MAVILHDNHNLAVVGKDRYRHAVARTLTIRHTHRVRPRKSFVKGAAHGDLLIAVVASIGMFVSEIAMQFAGRKLKECRFPAPLRTAETRIVDIDGIAPGLAVVGGTHAAYAEMALLAPRLARPGIIAHHDCAVLKLDNIRHSHRHTVAVTDNRLHVRPC